MLQKHELYIIKRGKQYLVGNPFNSDCACRLSPSPWDAYKAKNFNMMIRVAKLIGGKVMVFNQVNGNIAGGWK